MRCVKLALDHGISGALDGPASYFMKTPPVQHTDHEAREQTDAFIRKFGRPTIAEEKAPAKRAVTVNTALNAQEKSGV